MREFVQRWSLYSRDKNNPLWRNEEEIKRLKERNLRRQVELAAEFSPYYREVFHREGIEPDRIRTLKDLERLPLTPMEDYHSRPLSFLLEIDPPGELDATYEITYTSGTTGNPAPFFNTAYDMLNLHEQMRRSAEISWMTPADTVINLFPFGALPHIGFYRTAHLASATGMRLVNAMVGKRVEGFDVHRSVDEAAELAERQQASVLSGRGSFLRRFLRRARQLGVDLAEVRVVLALGEHVPERMREEIRSLLPSSRNREIFVNNGYGFTECQGIFVECCEFGGCHNPAPHIYHVEILDPGSLKPLPPGEPGLLAITHLDRRGTVLLRYLVGDTAAYEEGTCPHCGRSGGRLVARIGSAYAARSRDLVQVGKKVFDPEVVFRELSEIRGVVEYQLVVEKERPGDPLSPDRLIIRLSVAGRMRRDLEKEVVERVGKACGIKPVVEYVQSPEIYDPSRILKATRFLDLR